MPLTANCETGTNGNTISAGNPGSADAWDVVTIGAGAAIVYDNAHAYGSLAAKITQANPVVGVSLRWTTKFGTQTEHYGSFLLYATANPATSHDIWCCLTSGSFRARIYFRNDGKLSAVDAAGVVQGTTTNLVTLNQFVRIEYHVIHSLTVGQIELKLYNDPDSAIATEFLTTTPNYSTGVSSTDVRFGQVSSGPVSTTYWYDNMAAALTAWPTIIPSLVQARRL